MSTRSYSNKSDKEIDQMYELNTRYVYDNPTIIFEDDNELDGHIPLKHVLLMKLFTLKYGVKVGYIQMIDENYQNVNPVFEYIYHIYVKGDIDKNEIHPPCKKSILEFWTCANFS